MLGMLTEQPIFEVDPLQLVESKGMKVKDLNIAEAIIEEKKDEIIAKWKEIHG